MAESDSDRSSALGEVITFYSYKGGTGRSMLLANVAWLLASSGNKVLLIDWDLEAPGLHRYFRPFLGDDPELRSQEGVIDWVTDYWDACIDEPKTDVETLVRSFADPRHYVRKFDTGNFIVGGGIDLLCAGRQDHHYAEAVADFDWTRLYQKLRGAEFIEAAKQILVGPGGYDFVLVDSRTGVSDTSGFCTVGLADTLVVCFTYNNQSVIGASQIARNIKNQAESSRASQVDAGMGRRFRLFAVPCRVDDLDPERLERRQKHSWARFADLLTDVAPSQQSDYWVGVQIRNQALFAYEEVLAVCMSRLNDPQSVLGSIAELTRWLTDDAFTEIPALSDEQRSELRMRFAEIDESARKLSEVDAWALFIQRMPDAMAREAVLQGCFPLLVQLFTVTDSAHTPDPPLTFVRALLPEADLTDHERRMAEILTSNCITQRRMIEGRRRALLVRDDSILTHWVGLLEHLNKHFTFIRTRERIRRARQSWDAGGRSLDSLRGLQAEFGVLELGDEPRAWLGRPNLELVQAAEELNRSQRNYLELREKVRGASKREAATSRLYNWSLGTIIAILAVVSSSLFFLVPRYEHFQSRARLADAWQLIQKRKFMDAEAAFTPLADSSKADPAALFGRSYARGQLKKFDLAASDLRRAIELTSENGVAVDPQEYYFLGSYYKEEGNKVEARKALDTYIDQAKTYGTSVFDTTNVEKAEAAIRELDR